MLLEIMTAGILHDIVDDTDGTLEEIKKRYGDRVAYLVSSVSERDYPGEEPSNSWKRRKEESLRVLKNSDDTGVQMVWLADKVANIRSLAGAYSEKGEALWSQLNQSDPAMQCWYYRSIAEMVELSLNKTGAFKELIKHINFIWPGTFDSEKARYKKYREVSVDGCKLIGRGAKGNPWIFREAAAAVAGREIPARPSEKEVIDMLLRHARLSVEYKGEYTGIREMRKHTAWYTVGLYGSSKLRDAVNQVTSYREFEELIRTWRPD